MRTEDKIADLMRAVDGHVECAISAASKGYPQHGNLTSRRIVESLARDLAGPTQERAEFWPATPDAPTQEPYLNHLMTWTTPSGWTAQGFYRTVTQEDLRRLVAETVKFCRSKAPDYVSSIGDKDADALITKALGAKGKP